MLVAKNTLVVVRIIPKKDVISGSVAKITYIVFEIIFKVAVVTSSLVTSSVVNIFFVVTGIIFCRLTSVS